MKLKGGEIRLRSGTMFNPLSPDPVLIKIEDIAYGLAGQFRFAGHSRYTVAQHSVIGSRLLRERNLSLAFLLHDSDEALGLPDLARPVKHDPRFHFYREAGEVLHRAVEEKFGVDFSDPLIKWVDDAMLRTEQRELVGRVVKFGEDSFPIQIEVWSPKKAEREFLKRFYLLTGNSVKGNNTSGSSGRAGVGTEVDPFVVAGNPTNGSGSGRGADVRGETGGGGGSEVSGEEVDQYVQSGLTAGL